MGDVANLLNDDAFISDFARYSEGLLDEKFLRKKYRLAEETWTRLGKDDQLVEAIEAERLRRIRNGAAKREKSQALVVKAPDILSGIMLDPAQSAKHRIDSAKVLDAFSATGPENVPALDRFVITINLGGDQIHIDKPIAKDVTPNTTFHQSIRQNPYDTTGEIVDHDSETVGFCAAITARKNHSGGGGEMW